MNRSVEIEIKVGIFVAIGVGLVMLSIVLTSAGQSLFQRNISYSARFPQIEGVVEGANVKLAGIRVGQVSSVKFLDDKGIVEVTFAINAKYRDSIRQNSMVGIQTQGMLGDKYLHITPGSLDSPAAPENFELKSEAAKEIKDYLSNADEVIERLKLSMVHMESILGSFRKEGRADTLFKNLATITTNLNETTRGIRESVDHSRSIMAKIDGGSGTLGALVNDPSLYDDMKALLGGANRNRVLKYFIRKSVEESREAASKQAPSAPSSATKK